MLAYIYDCQEYLKRHQSENDELDELRNFPVEVGVENKRFYDFRILFWLFFIQFNKLVSFQR